MLMSRLDLVYGTWNCILTRRLDDKMKEDYNGDLYDVYYKDGNGERKCVCYFGYSKRDAERLFNSEKCVGEEIIEIKKCK